MKSATASPHRPRHDFAPQTNGNAPQHRPPLRSVKLTAETKKPSETLAGRFRELAVSNSVPVGFVLIVVCSTILIMSCVGRFLSVALDLYAR